MVVRVTERNLSLELKAESLEHYIDDIHHIEELLLYLVWTTEEVSIVLRERTHTGQAVKLATLLVTIDGTKLSNAQRQVTIRTRLPSENFAVVRTVHRLQHVLLILLRRMDGLEGILAIMSIVARGNVEVL
jgi:hypothetical protein